MRAAAYLVMMWVYVILESLDQDHFRVEEAIAVTVVFVVGTLVGALGDRLILWTQRHLQLRREAKVKREGWPTMRVVQGGRR